MEKMEAIMMIVSGFIFALARAAHGGGYVGRVLSILIMALGFALVHISTYGLIDAALYGAVTFFGLWLGLVFGWGKGFAAITGRYPITEKEFYPADLAGDYFAKKGDAYKAGVAFMTVRSIAFLPLFIVLAALTGDYYGYLFSSLFVLSMGGVYYGAGRVIAEKHTVRLAEVVYFFIIGAALA